MDSQVTPPKLARTIFEWFAKKAMVEDLYGDLEELFLIDIERMPTRKAKLLFWINAFSLSFSYTLKKRKQKRSMNQSSNTFAILKSYFTVGVRNLAKNRTFSLLNMIGLSAGMSISLLVVILIVNVWSFDDFQENRSKIHRVTTLVKDNYGKIHFATTLPILTDQIREKMPSTKVTNINTDLYGIVKHKGKELEIDGYFTDSQFLEIFTHEFISGNNASKLDEPNTIILTETASKRFFGESDPLDQVIETEFGDLIVAGVIADIPGNSHMNFEALASYATLEQLRAKNQLRVVNENWSSVGSEYVYFLSDDPSEIDHMLNNQSSQLSALQDDESVSFQLVSQDINAMIFGPSMARTIGPSYPVMNSILMFVVTLLVLLPACFNYINLSIARALKRGKEVGLRKIVGSDKRQTMLQFLVEAVIICCVSVMGSMVIVWLIKDDFVSMLASGSSLNHINIGVEGFIFALILGIFTAILAGLAPALYFARLKPLEAIKSGVQKKSKLGSLGLRKSLIVFQFALTLGFLIGVFSVIRQYQYSLTFDMGFERKNALVVPIHDADPTILKSELSSVEGITKVSLSSHIPGTNGASSSYILNQSTMDSVLATRISVDENYLESLGIMILRGNNLDGKSPISEKHVLVNEQFITSFGEEIGFGESADRWLLDNKPVKVIGIVENFNVSPLSEEIPPLVIEYDKERFRFATATLNTQQVPQVLADMEERWETFSKLPMESKFMDHHVEEALESYQVAIKVLGFQGFLVIVISCLGLLGMVVFTTENRTKEIGLRKVMGASESTLIWTIGKSFFKLLAVAIVVGSPFAYFIFNMLLANMQFYSKGLGVVELIVPAFIMLIIGGITIVLQTRSVAKINPVDNLRVE